MPMTITLPALYHLDGETLGYAIGQHGRVIPAVGDGWRRERCRSPPDVARLGAFPAGAVSGSTGPLVLQAVGRAQLAYRNAPNCVCRSDQCAHPRQADQRSNALMLAQAPVIG
jgi:hypothetical protein